MADTASPDDSPADDLARWARPRVRLVATAVAAGLAAGTVGTLALFLWAGDARFAASTVFALGALAFGFGLLGWSGSALAGRGVENMQRHLDADSEWTEADSRRAMARVGGFGAGTMLAVVLFDVGRALV